MICRELNRAALTAAVLVSLAGCAADNAYQKAFSDKSALVGNARTYSTAPLATLRVVKQTLVHQGFTIEQADVSTGLVKAVRNYQDPTDPTLSYNISATADITPTDTGNGSDVTLAASQQTILHREWHTWWHLLWILPLFPTGTEYQTVVTKEGNVNDIAFYNDFFAAVDRGIARSDAAASAKAADTGSTPAAPIPSPATETPSPSAAPTADVPPAPAAAPSTQPAASADLAPSGT